MNGHEPGTLFDQTIYDRLTHYVRMADKSRAAECVVKLVVDSLTPYLGEREWVSLSPTLRRDELFALLKVAANKMNDLADRINEDGRKFNRRATTE